MQIMRKGRAINENYWQAKKIEMNGEQRIEWFVMTLSDQNLTISMQDVLLSVIYCTSFLIFILISFLYISFRLLGGLFRKCFSQSKSFLEPRSKLFFISHFVKFSPHLILHHIERIDLSCHSFIFQLPICSFPYKYQFHPYYLYPTLDNIP